MAEAALPRKVFKDSGPFVDFASVQGGQHPRDEVDSEDPIQVAFTEDESTRAGLFNTPASMSLIRTNMMPSSPWAATAPCGNSRTAKEPVRTNIYS